VFVLTLLVAAASTATAQNWRGSATLGVAVKSGKGSAIQAALVTIAYRDIGYGDGPPARRTDTQGEANFTGISPGTWSLKIDHPDHLSYLATVVVRKGKKPQVLTEFLEATGRGRLTMRVKPLKGVAGDRGTPVEPVRTAATPAPAAEAQPEKAAPTPSQLDTTTPRAERIAAPEGTRPVDAVPADPEAASPPSKTAAGKPLETTEREVEAEERVDKPAVVEPPTVEQLEVPAAKPTTASADEDSSALTVQKPVEPDTVPVPAVSVPPVAPPAPTPTVEHEEQDVPAEDSPASHSEPDAEPAGGHPTPPSTTVTVLPPGSKPRVPEPRPPISDRRTLRSYKDRTCFECKPGEWSVASTVSAGAADLAPCASVPEARLRKLMTEMTNAQGDRLAGYGGPLPETIPDLAPELQPLLSGSCRLVAVVLPQGARFTGFRFQASDQRDGGDCLGDQECAVGSARWLFNPGIAKSSGATVVFSDFQNTGPTRERTATLIAYFIPPGSWIAGL
jgi:hypothetical protein